MSPIKKRIFVFFKSLGLPKGETLEKLSIGLANFHGSAAFSELGGDKIQKILSNYPQLNPDWLLLGNGSMLREGAAATCCINAAENERQEKACVRCEKALEDANTAWKAAKEAWKVAFEVQTRSKELERELEKCKKRE